MSIVPAQAYWWSEPKWNIAEKDVVHLAMVDLRDKHASTIDGLPDHSIEACIDNAMHEVKHRQQDVYNNIRQRGRKTPRWATFMELIIEEVESEREEWATGGH